MIAQLSLAVLLSSALAIKTRHYQATTLDSGSAFAAWTKAGQGVRNPEPHIMYLMRYGSAGVPDALEKHPDYPWGYNSTLRLAAIKETWAADLSESDLVLMGPGNKYGCEDDHWLGLCCKEASGEEEAMELMTKTDHDWFVVIDDDHYIHKRNMAAALQKLDPNELAVYGTPGCGTCGTNGLHGICGGGTFALSRASMEKLAETFRAKGKGAYVAEFMEVAKGAAATWADVAFGCNAQAHGLALRHLPGAYDNPIENDQAALKAGLEGPVKATNWHMVNPAAMKEVHRAVINHNQASLLQGEPSEYVLHEGAGLQAYMANVAAKVKADNEKRQRKHADRELELFRARQMHHVRT